MKAMLFAAGLGTRLKPLTDYMPKAMVPIAGQPLLGIVIKKLKDSGVTDLVVNVHHLGQQIIDFLATKDWGIQIHVSDERQDLLDTGGGLRHAACFWEREKDPVLIHNVDILSDANLSAFYEFSRREEVSLLVSNRKTSRYLLFDEHLRLVGWTNTDTGELRTPFPNLNVEECHQYAFSGIHSFSPSLFHYMSTFPEKFPIMDFYLTMCDRIQIRAYFVPELHLLDIGKLDTLEKAEDFVREYDLL